MNPRLPLRQVGQARYDFSILSLSFGAVQLHVTPFGKTVTIAHYESKPFYARSSATALNEGIHYILTPGPHKCRTSTLFQRSAASLPAARVQPYIPAQAMGPFSQLVHHARAILG